jgi:hypothetical protein
VLEIVWINGGPNASLSSLRSVRVGVKSPMILSRRTSATVGRWGIVGMGATLGQPRGLPILCGFSKLSLFSHACETESIGHSSQLSNSLLNRWPSEFRIGPAILSLLLPVGVRIHSLATNSQTSLFALPGSPIAYCPSAAFRPLNIKSI